MSTKLTTTSTLMIFIAALVGCTTPPPDNGTDSEYVADNNTGADDDLPCDRTSEAPYVRTTNALTGNPTWWPDDVVAGCIPLSVDPAPPEEIAPQAARDALWRAAGTWDSVTETCEGQRGVCFRDGGDISGEDGYGYDPEGPNYNVVTYLRSEAEWNARNNPSAVAATTYTSVARTGKIIDADIEMNDARWVFSTTVPVPTNAFDLESVLVHELGHVLGFDHTADPVSVMFPSEEQTNVEARRTLTEADRLGLCEAYACY